jgi:TRAP-type uncharacterized transport system substrate-binding protein
MHEMEEVYNKYLTFTDLMLGEYDPMYVAAVMMAQALSIYRTGMDEEDYNKIVDSMSENRDKVQTFNPRTMQ